MCPNKEARQLREILGADQFFDQGKGGLHRLDQRYGDIVAIDRVARAGGPVRAICQPVGDRMIRVQKPRPEFCLTRHAASARAARLASARRVAQSGTSLSHSTSTGVGPVCDNV